MNSMMIDGLISLAVVFGSFAALIYIAVKLWQYR
jgi:hypothetical protein